MKKRLIAIGFIGLLVIVAVAVFVGQHVRKDADIYYSGTVEAKDQAELAFQMAGRVAAVLIDEGQRADAGMVLARLDSREAVANLARAEAELARSRAVVKQLEALLSLRKASLPAGVSRAEAVLSAARSERDLLEAGFRAQEIEQSRLAEAAARAVMEEARREKERMDRLYADAVVSKKQRDAATLAFDTAARAFEQAAAAYDLRREGNRRERIQSARARLEEAEAGLRTAKAELKRLDVTEQELHAAKAGQAAAEAAVELARVHVGYTELSAPFAGIVVSRNITPGEVVTAGRDALSLTDLGVVELKIFVGETEIGRVTPGQAAVVRTDTFPDREFAGTVSYISPEAEFTPKMIQTHAERVKLVYLVKIMIENADLALKPGMPADAWLR